MNRSEKQLPGVGDDDKVTAAAKPKITFPPTG